MKKILAGLVGLMATVALMPLFAAFEAHVVNVTAKIENALDVHPQSIQYGTVFPQEHLFSDFFIGFSNSFSTDNQIRVGKVDYVIKQKPKPKPAFLESVGVEAARDYCHLNSPQNAGDPNDPYYAKCYPNLCSYLSKHETTTDGQGENDGPEIPPFHDPNASSSWAHGLITKFGPSGAPNTIGRDSSDNWDIDLAVPCFEGMCAQDWNSFVLGLNPNAGDPAKYQLPPTLEHEIFGCDLWVEVTKIY